MCKVYNPVGCLTIVKSELQRHNFTEFKSLNEVIAFQKDYDAYRRLIISKSEVEIENEKRNLISESLELTDAIEKRKIEVEKEVLEEINSLKLRLENFLLPSENSWRKISRYIKVFFLKKKIRHEEANLAFKISRSVSESMNSLEINQRRYNYIASNYQEAVMDNCLAELNTLNRKKAVIDDLNSFIYGALGEQKVAKELERLSDEYVLINDFCLSFTPAMYNRRENEYIKSIQVDHLLIGPSGVFIIETKNWSEQSLKNLDLRSPISQIRRTNFALFKVLANRTATFGLNQHHWGKKKIPLRNLVVLINQKPQGEFEHVKILTLNELLSYIKYFPPVFTKREKDEIANDLLNLSKMG